MSAEWERARADLLAWLREAEGAPPGEPWLEEPPGPRAAVRAVALRAWARLTGGPPVPPEPADLARRLHRAGSLPPFLPRHPVPPGLEAWLRRCLDPDPARRPASPAEARAALEKLGPAEAAVELGGLAPDRVSAPGIEADGDLGAILGLDAAHPFAVDPGDGA